MFVLEQIVEGSTAMFERLAQFEDFHYTVDLPILVSAAQEKVVKWLQKWQPKKGRLFSWFCLHRDTLITLEDGSMRPIGELVRERYAGKVLCWNFDLSTFEAKQVTDWSEEPCKRKDWRKLVIFRPSGYGNPIYITHDHRVRTQAGWKQVDHLCAQDTLYLNRPTLTPEGEAALIGLLHQSVAREGYSWKVFKRFKVYRENAHTARVRYGATSESFGFKYDLTVEDNHNFFAGRRKLLIHNSKCAKNAFRSELVKVNQYRKRYHVTSDNLEKFYGIEDHDVDKRDVATEFQAKIKQMSCRWGDPQELGAIRYLVECVLDDERDKQGAIRGACYAWGISPDMSKFFYGWVVSALRHELYDQVHIPFTEQDLFRAAFAYEHVVDLLDYVDWETAKKIIARWQGMRIKFPTLAHMAKVKENYQIHRDVEKGDLDPDAVAEVARKHKRTARSAQEVFNEMVTILDPKRTGEYAIYDDGTTEH